MKKINLLYWIFTGLYVLLIVPTSVPGIMGAPDSVKVVVNQLGYPAYFLPFVSVAKILGGIAIIIPGFPRIKEWAYAGLMIDVISAIYSFIAIGLSPAQWAPVLLFLVILSCSYIFYHKRLKMQSLNVKQ